MSEDDTDFKLDLSQVGGNDDGLPIDDAEEGVEAELDDDEEDDEDYYSTYAKA
ncbi:MAG: hypothetical protein HZA94_02820 [Candidatus Vogelbacteria bacterium]|nr:hypothetical protein [Candidatus Vogelbacteria bacterium]